MAKLRSKPHQKKAGRRRQPKQDDIPMDEVDAFHASRDKVYLDDERDQSDGFSDIENNDEEVLAMGEKEFDAMNDEELKKYIKKMPSLRKRLGALEREEQEDQDEEVEDVDVMAWGQRRGLYYQDDEDELEDEEAAKEQEEEALRLQKERAAAMKDADFLEDFEDALGAVARRGEGSGSMAPPASGDQATVRELNDELDKIDLTNNTMENLAASKDLSHLSKQEILDHITSESPELLDLLSELKTKAEEVTAHVTPLLERVQSGSVPMNKGLTFLELKNQLLLTYCMNLAFYFYLKVDGRRVKDHPVIQKLVELRMYLEKMKPIEQKLKYQIDKLVKAGLTGQVEQQDSLALKANPSNFDVDGDEKAVSDEGSDDEDGGIYKAPRIAPVHFDEEPDADAKRRNAAERVKKLAGKSRLMQDLMAEVAETPEEVMDAGNMLTGASQKDTEWQDRVRAEEEMMVRLPVTKKDKKKMRARNTFANELENLDDFGDAMYLDQLDETMADESSSKKKSVRSVIRQGLSLGDEESTSKKRGRGGDDDVPYRDSKSARRNHATAGEDYNTHLDDEDAFSDTHNDYTQAKEDVQRRKQARKDAYQTQVEEQFEGFGGDVDNDLEEGDKRQVNYDILKNKGLTPARKKDQRNPRVKHRKKYEKSMKKLKSFKPTVRAPTSAYGGEGTGIKKNLARSVKF